MEDVCSIEQMQILINGLTKQGTYIIQELMEVFPFEDMGNISSDDHELIRLHAIFLSILSGYDNFFEQSRHLTDTFNFLWKNFTALKDAQTSDVFSELLILFKLIIKRFKFNSNTENFIQMNQENLSKLFAYISTLSVFSKQHVNDYLLILSGLTTMKYVSSTISKCLIDIFEKVHSLGAVCELISFCKMLLEQSTVSTDTVKHCVSWLLIQGPNEIFMNNGDIVMKFMEGMNYVCNKYYCLETYSSLQDPDFFEQVLNSFLEKLHSVFDQILNLTCNPKLRQESLKLVAFLISICARQNLAEVFSRLIDLPMSVTDWPKTKSDIFFTICAIQIGNKGKSFWPATEVLTAISGFIYSHHRYSINKNILKTICYIYPFMLKEFTTVFTITHGDSLLLLMEKFIKSLNEILTYELNQLLWIMVKGTDMLKRTTLSYWLLNGDFDILLKALDIHDFSCVLFELLVDEDIDENLAQRVIQVVHKIQNSKLSERIAYSLPLFFGSSLIFNRLMICNPGVIQNEDSLAKLCTFVSVVMLLINEEHIFREACLYLKKIIVALKCREDIVQLASPAFYNLDYYLLKLFFAKDDTALEILGLLKALLLVQKRHHIKLEVKIKTDLSIQLNGSTEKLSKCLDLVEIIVKSNKLVLAIDETRVQNLALAIYSLFSQQDLSNQCLTCLLEIFKRNHELSLSASTSLFIEINCNLEVQIYWPRFTFFLTYWLKIVRKLKLRKPILHFGVLVNYIDRLTYLPQAEKMKLKKMINGIMVLPDARDPLKIELERITHQCKLANIC